MFAMPPTLRQSLGSFRLRLVAYFLLLSLLPLMGALWAFSEVAATSETGRADARLNAALRVAVSSFGDRTRTAETTAASLARATGFQRALAPESRGALARLYREVPNAGFYIDGQLIAGSPAPALAVRRSARVVDDEGKLLGTVVVSVPLDAGLVANLRKRQGFEEGDQLALTSDGRVVVGPAELARANVSAARSTDVEIGGERYRTVGARLSRSRPQATLVALAPSSNIEAGAADLRRRMLIFAAIALAAAAAIAYALGRTIVRSLRELAEAAGAVARGNFSSRVPVRGHDEFGMLGRTFNEMAEHLEGRLEELAWERARAREALTRFGEALAATNNPYQLLPVIVESVVEATGASGGRLLVDGEEVARAGLIDAAREPYGIPLGDDGDEVGVLILVPPQGGFSPEARDLANWLAVQSWTALENARLHLRLERQAVTDGLTELPNRRQFEESLTGEVTRVQRFGGSLALIVADLDDFKRVNDRFGHLAGDDVLRTFADVLRETVREIDVPVRYGGEEFAILLPQTDAEGAEQVAERIRVSLEERSVEVAPGVSVRVTASFGVATYPDEPDEDTLVAAADRALYDAKEAGKNLVVVAGTRAAVREER
jgi:diguanylate cyclase (GGDEF)-like protein